MYSDKYIFLKNNLYRLKWFLLFKMGGHFGYYLWLLILIKINLGPHKKITGIKLYKFGKEW